MKILFYGTIKDEWDLFEKCVKSIQANFYPATWQIYVVDDGSKTSEAEKARVLKTKIQNLTIVPNLNNEGIIPSLNKCIDYIRILKKQINICIPVSADSFFINKKYPFLLLWAFTFRKADYFFAKTVHKTDKNKITGVTGWSENKGIQNALDKKKLFLTGKCRPSGWAVAFRASKLKQYNYPDVGSLSDYYLNNLMILKHKSYYSPQKVVATLERGESFSTKFSKEDNKKNLLKCVDLFNSQGIDIDEDDVRRLIRAEKLN